MNYKNQMCQLRKARVLIIKKINKIYQKKENQTKEMKKNRLV